MVASKGQLPKNASRTQTMEVSSTTTTHARGGFLTKLLLLLYIRAPGYNKTADLLCCADFGVAEARVD